MPILGTTSLLHEPHKASEIEGHGWTEELTPGSNHTQTPFPWVFHLDRCLAFCCRSHLLAQGSLRWHRNILELKGLRYIWQEVMLVKGLHVNTTDIISVKLGWNVFDPACSLWSLLPAGKKLIADEMLVGMSSSFGLHRTYHQSKYKSDAGTMLTRPAAQLSESSPVKRNASGKLRLTLLSHSGTHGAPKLHPGAAVQLLPFLPWHHLPERILIHGW